MKEPTTNEEWERYIWLAVRQAMLMIVGAIERRYNLRDKKGLGSSSDGGSADLSQ